MKVGWELNDLLCETSNLNMAYFYNDELIKMINRTSNEGIDESIRRCFKYMGMKFNSIHRFGNKRVNNRDIIPEDIRMMIMNLDYNRKLWMEDTGLIDTYVEMVNIYELFNKKNQ